MHLHSPFILIISQSIVLMHLLGLVHYYCQATIVFDRQETMDFLLTLMSMLLTNRY